MKIRFNLAFCVGVAYLLFVASSNAATIEITTQDLNGSSPDANFGTTTIDTVLDGLTNGTRTSGPTLEQSGFGGGIGFATGSGDIVTGQLSLQVTGSADGGGNFGGISANSTVTITESFTVQGTGLIDAFLDVSGDYNIVTLPQSWQIQASVQMSGVGITGDTDSLLLNQLSPASGVLDSLLAAQVFVADGDVLSISYMLLGQLSAIGEIDLSNTGNAFIQVAQGVTLTPTDPNFLTDPAFDVSQIPVPAALPLFGTGLATISLLGLWRRRRNAAVVDRLNWQPDSEVPGEIPE